MKFTEGKWLIVFCACVALASPPALSDPGDQEAQARALEDARRELDAAAKRFAELHESRDLNVFESAEERAFLGIILSPVPDDSDVNGLLVIGVSPGSGAERAGVQNGDVVTRIDTTDLSFSEAPTHELRTAMDAVTPGDIVTVGISRDGVDLVLDVQTEGRQTRKVIRMGRAEGDVEHETATFMFRSEDGTVLNDFDFDVDVSSLAKRNGNAMTHGSAVAAPVRPRLHLVDVSDELGPYFGVTSGALVISSDQENPLRPGDVVQAIGDEVVRTAVDAYRAMDEVRESATAQIVRQQSSMSVEVAPLVTRREYIKRKAIKLRREQ